MCQDITDSWLGKLTHLIVQFLGYFILSWLHPLFLLKYIHLPSDSSHFIILNMYVLKLFSKFKKNLIFRWEKKTMQIKNRVRFKRHESPFPTQPSVPLLLKLFSYVSAQHLGLKIIVGYLQKYVTFILEMFVPLSAKKTQTKETLKPSIYNCWLFYSTLADRLDSWQCKPFIILYLYSHLGQFLVWAIDSPAGLCWLKPDGIWISSCILSKQMP